MSDKDSRPPPRRALPEGALCGLLGTAVGTGSWAVLEAGATPPWSLVRLVGELLDGAPGPTGSSLPLLLRGLAGQLLFHVMVGWSAVRVAAAAAVRPVLRYVWVQLFVLVALSGVVLLAWRGDASREALPYGVALTTNLLTALVMACWLWYRDDAVRRAWSVDHPVPPSTTAPRA